MGNLRKDYVSERFVIVNQSESKKTKTRKNPYKAGNESMTKPSVLSLVQKDGMLQRLQDDEDEIVKGWSVRVFPAPEPYVETYADKREQEYGAVTEQIEFITENGLEAWQTKVAEIKAKHPKE